MPVSEEQLIALMKSKGITDEQINQGRAIRMARQATPHPKQGTSVSDMLNKIGPGLSGAVGNVAGTVQQLAGVNPQNQNDDIQNLYAKEAIKSQFEDPTIRQLREAEINALNQPPPTGTIRVGRQVITDPTYIKPTDQAKMDEAAEAASFAEESIKGKAKESLSAIEKAKQGSKFFGPYGGIPTLYDPQSLLGMNKEHYGQRKEWENNVNKLLAQKVVDLITEMKQASRTGATGFGSLTEKEGEVLRQASTVLSKDLPEDVAVQYLNDMERIYQKILGGSVSQQPTTEVSKVQKNPADMTDEEIQAELNALGG